MLQTQNTRSSVNVTTTQDYRDVRLYVVDEGRDALTGSIVLGASGIFRIVPPAIYTELIGNKTRLVLPELAAVGNDPTLTVAYNTILTAGLVSSTSKLNLTVSGLEASQLGQQFIDGGASGSDVTVGPPSDADFVTNYWWLLILLALLLVPASVLACCCCSCTVFSYPRRREKLEAAEAEYERKVRKKSAYHFQVSRNNSFFCSCCCRCCRCCCCC